MFTAILTQISRFGWEMRIGNTVLTDSMLTTPTPDEIQDWLLFLSPTSLHELEELDNCGFDTSFQINEENRLGTILHDTNLSDEQFFTAIANFEYTVRININYL